MVKRFIGPQQVVEHTRPVVVLTNEQKLSLYKKSQKSGVSTDVLEEVYRRGYNTWSDIFGGTPEQFAFDRVNSFIAGGFAAMLDEDLRKDNPCWKGYKAVGVKKKNGKTVPNCVPESLDVSTPSISTIAQKHDKPISVIRKALKKGINVEKEHTKDTRQANEIARDHLAELPDYYKRLAKAEKGQVKEGLIGAVGKINTSSQRSEPISRNPNDPSSRFVGTNELTTIYKSRTPGQVIKAVVREAVNEATYQGKEVPLNKPMKGDVKKSKVYVDPDGDGKAQKVNFGDKTLSIKKDQPDRKASYCARSGGIKGKGDVTSANYWSRKAWDC